MPCEQIIDLANRFRVKGDTAYMTIATRDGSEVVAKFDAEDLDKVKQFCPWQFHTGRCNTNYVMAFLATGKFMQLSRCIVDAQDYVSVSHINGDPLDCRKSNLATSRIFRKRSTNPSPYVGEIKSRYYAQVYDSEKKKGVRVGHFETLEAAIAAQQKAINENENYRVPGLKSTKEQNAGMSKCR